MPATGRSTRVDLSIRIFFNYACYILPHLCYARETTTFVVGELFLLEKWLLKLRDSNWRREYPLLPTQLGRPQAIMQPPPHAFIFTASYVSFCLSGNVLCSPNPLLQFLLDTFLPVLPVEVLIHFGDSFSPADEATQR